MAAGRRIPHGKKRFDDGASVDLGEGETRMTEDGLGLTDGLFVSVVSPFASASIIDRSNPCSWIDFAETNVGSEERGEEEKRDGEGKVERKEGG